ncbi:MAG: DUF2971 domain-containing protein [Anaerostipes hadrus]|nr:DUF2971 domain-containing protein [Anaerostipes hadrus]
MKRKLYRYRSFNTDKITGYSYIHQSEINIEKWKFEAFEGLVYPSSPLYFNDPYDCEFCFQSDVLENIIDRETYLHLLEKRFSLKKEEKDRILYSANIERAMQIVLQAHNAKLSDSWMDILKSGLSGCMDTLKDAVRVVCLSELYDSMLMWSHYAQNHTGYCIEYIFEESDMYYTHLHPVIYTKDRYSLSKKDVSEEKKDVLYKTTCSKSDVWSYEKEWRIVTANYNKVMPQKLEHPDGRYVLDLKNNIKAFYLGTKISADFKAELIEFGKKNDISVYQMVLSSTTYDLKAEKIV